MKVVVVGAGISGLTAAALLQVRGHEVVIYETRNQIGGNCADTQLDDSTRLHIYGPHIFHTTSDKVWMFLNTFTTFNDYEHRVIANTPKGHIPIPFNLVSEDKLGPLSDDEVRDLLFVDYSVKMWGREWEYLPDVIKKRVPQRRKNRDCRYFTDPHQGIPSNGYQQMFEAMAEGCTVHLNCSARDWHREDCDLLVYTGLIDEFYDFSLGRLHYKTLDITTRPKYINERFPAAVINQCNRLPFTRKADHSWWHGQEHDGVGLVTMEHPRDWQPDDIPYYPIPFGEDQAMADEYANLTTDGKTMFLGRLATYKYLNIDSAVLQALEAVEQFA